MNPKISVVVICIEAIIYLLLFNLHDCTFNFQGQELIERPWLLIKEAVRRAMASVKAY